MSFRLAISMESLSPSFSPGFLEILLDASTRWVLPFPHISSQLSFRLWDYHIHKTFFQKIFYSLTSCQRFGYNRPWLKQAKKRREPSSCTFIVFHAGMNVPLNSKVGISCRIFSSAIFAERVLPWVAAATSGPWIIQKEWREGKPGHIILEASRNFVPILFYSAVWDVRKNAIYHILDITD